MADGPLRNLLTEGVVGGVGSVISFLPQILILFLFVGILEDCGYMARAAYLMDRLMSRVGLSGRSFIPSSPLRLAVPGIMAARVIENERDRLTTIVVSPLLTCSARLPVYALLIAAFIPETSWCGGLLGLQGLTLAGLYLLGIVAAVAVALILKRTLLRAHTPPFLLELPSYKWPSVRIVAYRMIERASVFLRTAGTLILALAVVVWAAAYYPHHGDQSKSYLGRLGRMIEPVVKPLGWDWRIGCAVAASLPAREVVVATLGVLYGVGKEPESAATTSRLQAKLRAATWEGTDRPVFTVPRRCRYWSFMRLCMQCALDVVGDSARDEQFALAGLRVRLYDGAGLCRGVGDVSSWYMVGDLTPLAASQLTSGNSGISFNGRLAGDRSTGDSARRGGICCTAAGASLHRQRGPRGPDMRRLPARDRRRRLADMLWLPRPATCGGGRLSGPARRGADGPPARVDAEDSAATKPSVRGSLDRCRPPDGSPGALGRQERSITDDHGHNPAR